MAIDIYPFHLLHPIYPIYPNMNLFQLFKNLRPFVKPYKWLVFITLILTLVGSLMAQVNAIVLDRTVDAINALIGTNFQWGQAARIMTIISIVLFIAAFIFYMYLKKTRPLNASEVQDGSGNNNSL